MEQVVIFIDGSNLYYGLKRNNLHKSIDFAKFAAALCKTRKLVKICYYVVAYKKEYNEAIYEKQQKFLTRLRHTPQLEISYGRLIKREAVIDEQKILKDLDQPFAQEILKRLKRIVTLAEKRIDVNIAVDMVAMAYNNFYDTAILVSSDADFLKAIETVRAQAKRVENAYFEIGHSNQLKKACDGFTLIDQNLISKCEIKEYDDSWWF
ncbi:MAG: NYN domain-containing protein [Candidatus Omnitrophica bacterium]|nr:NYN domain-containing protein [Candidatus Omnitrophota bacterium]